MTSKLMLHYCIWSCFGTLTLFPMEFHSNRFFKPWVMILVKSSQFWFQWFTDRIVRSALALVQASLNMKDYEHCIIEKFWKIHPKFLRNLSYPGHEPYRLLIPENSFNIFLDKFSRNRYDPCSGNLPIKVKRTVCCELGRCSYHTMGKFWKICKFLGSKS